MKVCVIGAGRWGKNHIRTLSQLGVLGAIVDSRQDVLDKFREEYSGIQTYTNLDASGAMDYDAYTVVVPAEHHHSVAKRLIEAGKHVLVEKPITLNSADAQDLITLAKKHNVQLMVGHLLLFHPAFLKMKELIEGDKIGKLQYIYSNRLNLGTVRTEENSLWSFAPHDISLFQYLIGGYPTKVHSSGGAFLQPHIHDTTMTMIHYPDNVIGHIFVSWLHPFKEHRFVVIGSKGMLSYEDSSPSKELVFYEKGIDWVNGEPVKRDGPTEVITYDNMQPLSEELSHFVEASKGNEPNTKISGEMGMDVLQILETAQEQLETETGKKSEAELESNEPKPYFAHETAVVDTPVTIGVGTKIWHYSHVLSDAQIGEGCILGQNVSVGKGVKIGNKVKIQNNVSVYEGVELEDYVFCGPSMVFTNINNPRSKYPQADQKYYIKTLVREGASIGANATIVCGVTIGRFAFIGAGTVVTKDVPDFAMIVGNPGRVVGWMSEAGQKLVFDEATQITCKKSGVTYEFKDGLVHETSPVTTQ
ncbi:Gfo/Idh/MocA family oxidoreductase [bacterium]|jgi:UDP-2-acetamido-3-amino-2,3-dideoxy-glucuronate N-acetyltransferase|nr:Gfo/Idh/MocA family oxidoreductase [bacterium]